jgi:hypothetical protein
MNSINSSGTPGSPGTRGTPGPPPRGAATAIRWPLVLTAGAGVTATSSLLVAATVLGVMLTWGFGLLLLPVPLAVVGVMVQAGGATLRQAGVARPNLVAWLVSLPTIPLATVVSTIIPLNVVSGRTLPGAMFLTVAIGAILPVAGALGAGAWWLAARASGPRQP